MSHFLNSFQLCFILSALKSTNHDKNMQVMSNMEGIVFLWKVSGNFFPFSQYKYN